MNKTKNPKQEPLSGNGSKVIKSKLTLENNFYMFIRKRFHYLMTQHSMTGTDIHVAANGDKI